MWYHPSILKEDLSMTDPEPNEIAHEEEITAAQEVEAVEAVEREKPALTIVIQSWATPLLAVLMLIIGLAGGYFGRPLLDRNKTAGAPVTVSTTEEVQPTTDPAAAATAEARGQQLLDAVVSQTRHWLGDENAPVSIIEFSDFQ
jgi:hypothetical protein